MPDSLPRSAVEAITWPAMPDTMAAAALALQFQLDRSQYWPEAELRAQQFAQLELLLAQCRRQVPFYRDRLEAAGLGAGAAVTPERWARLPVLTRSEVQGAGNALHAAVVPQQHGAVVPTATSGSTGTPVKGLKTALLRHFFEGLVLRDALWHGLDLSAKHAVIRRDHENRAQAPEGRQLPHWGGAIATVFPTGPVVLADIRSPTEAQVEFLLRERPGVLLTMPSNMALLARHCLDRGIRPQGLQVVRSFGEVLSEETREIVRQAWGVSVQDAYSAEEIGHIALQCPLHPHYHVQSEAVLLELLREDGSACAAGETGRVVVTPLHNFAMPLLRYALGDYAVAGAACSCGRTLPVLERILGRERHRVVLPSGERRYAFFGSRSFHKVPALQQYQLVQISRTEVEIRMVVRRPLTEDEEEMLARSVIAGLGHEFVIWFVYVDAIARSASGKYEDFRSEVA